MAGDHMDPSAQIYSKLMLRFYDWYVLSFSNNYAWRCPTESVLLPFFQEHIGESAHLDVGVGTGFYPSHSAAKLGKCKSLTLFDLNPNTLQQAEAATRAAGYKGEIEIINGSVLDPLPENLRGRFDSISFFYVFHCLSWSFPSKASHVMTNLISALAPDGVIYGATILGHSAGHNWIGKFLMSQYNSRGYFGNADDTYEDLEKGLKGLFEEVEIKQVGVVALFTLRKPIQSK